MGSTLRKEPQTPYLNKNKSLNLLICVPASLSSSSTPLHFYHNLTPDFLFKSRVKSDGNIWTLDFAVKTLLVSENSV